MIKLELQIKKVVYHSPKEHINKDREKYSSNSIETGKEKQKQIISNEGRRKRYSIEVPDLLRK